MGHERAPNFAAIDPAAMADLVTKLEGAARTVDEQAPGLKSRFESQGVGTGNVSTIMQVASWVRDQLPMLRRRQSLAQAMVDGGFAYGAGSTWTFIDNGANLGAFRTPEEARRAAADLAARVKGDPAGHDLPDEVFEQLLRYGNDPDFVAEFYSQVGPEGVGKLYVGAHQDRDLGDGPDPRKAMAIGYSLATASHRLNFDESWIDRLGRRTTAAPQLYVAPFLRYGSWDKDVLKRIGNRELKGAAIPLDPERAAMIWDGIARNPVAAAEFYDENFELIQKKGAYDGMLRGDQAEGNRNAWAAMVRSATVDAHGVYARLRLDDPAAWPRNLAEDNTARLIRYVNDHEDEHVFGELQAAYGEVLKEYWDDLAYAVASPVPQVGDRDNPGRDGIEVPRDAWAAFTHEAMRDGQTAANLLTQFRVWMGEQTSAQAAPHTVGRTGTEQGDPFAWQDASVGRMRQFFQSNYGEVVKALSDEHEQWQQNVEKGIETAIGWAFDPKGIVKDVGKLAVTEFVKHTFRELSEQELKELDLSALSSSSRWQDLANQHHAERNIPPITVDGITWEGAPGFYEDLYRGRFTDGDGRVLPVDRMSPEGVRAYNEWLQDPAVVAAVEEGWFQEQGGFGGAQDDPT
jgi:hypothetical protein